MGEKRLGTVVYIQIRIQKYYAAMFRRCPHQYHSDYDHSIQIDYIEYTIGESLNYKKKIQSQKPLARKKTTPVKKKNFPQIDGRQCQTKTKRKNFLKQNTAVPQQLDS